MKDKFLPIGTVAVLEGAVKKVMIIGYKPKSEQGEVYDFIGCLYPEGIVTTDQYLVFNYDQIKRVFQQGYSDDECAALKLKIEEINNKE